MMLAGAAAVEGGSGKPCRAYACRDIIADLPSAMEKYGITKLSEITGGAH